MTKNLTIFDSKHFDYIFTNNAEKYFDFNFKAEEFNLVSIQNRFLSEKRDLEKV